MNNNQNQEKAKVVASSATSRSDRLKEIDALYKSQMKQLNFESKGIDSDEKKFKVQSPPQTKKFMTPSLGDSEGKEDDPKLTSPSQQSFVDLDKRIRLNISDKIDEQKIRASTFLQGESTRTIQILRKENENKEMKIRQLSSKCEGLIEKLKSHLSPTEIDAQIESLKEFSDRKMQRLQNLFKIKNEEIFFKIKLQIIGLLQEFQVSKEEITGINEVNNESALFSFMVRKLKIKLKDFRSKQQESNFQIQKDKILNQKNEERIHYLMETNELLKLSESKLKTKIEDLKAQMSQFIQKIKVKELQLEEKDNEVFRLKKQIQELQAANQKLTHLQRNIAIERSDQKRIFQAKQKEMKTLLSSYFLERKKLQAELEEKQGYIEQILIKQKFLQQENERINREYVRWKQRYEWLEKEKENRQRQFEQEKVQIMGEFEQYKRENNQGQYMNYKTEADEALRKVEEYQIAYQKILIELEEERKLNMEKQEEAQNQLDQIQREWYQKVKRIQKMKEEELYQIAADHENRQKELREQYEKRQELLAEEMQARMKALIAESDKKTTEKLIQFETQNDELRKQIESLNKVIEVKESLISVINSNKQ